MRAISRVDIHLHQAGARAAELQIDPFGAIGRPDAHAIAGRKAESNQSARRTLHFICKLAPREPDVLMPCNERLVIGMPGYRIPKHLTGGFGG